MSENSKDKPNLGDRMGDLGGLRILRNGKWVSLEKPTPKKDTK